MNSFGQQDYIRLVLGIHFSRVKWEEAHERKHIEDFYFHFYFLNFLISPVGDEQFQSYSFQEEQKGGVCNDANEHEQQPGKEMWHLPPRPFPLHFFLQDSSCFPALNAPPNLGWGFESMFFQAWAPKSWELHLMLSCQSTVDLEVWSVADGSGVRSRMCGVSEVWEPLTSVCFGEGWCGSLESKESNISLLISGGVWRFAGFPGSSKGKVLGYHRYLPEDRTPRAVELFCDIAVF